MSHFRKQLLGEIKKADNNTKEAVQSFIVLLIVLSSGIALLQLMWFSFLDSYAWLIEKFELIVLGIFTIEFLFRLFISESYKRFFNSSMNWIDLISIVPFYFGMNNTVLLRLFRIMRVVRLSRKDMLDFFDKPKSNLAVTVRFLIITLIILSVSLALLQILFPDSLEPYIYYITQFEYLVLGIFTIEFFARFFAQKSLLEFIKKPENWIDFLAIAPFYFGINNATILRVFRVLRLFKLINSISILRSASFFDFKHSILRIVSPLIVIFIFIKWFIWILESRWLWIANTDFGTLFTIIGFSLGVVLSQKIWKSYSKYLFIQDSMYSLHWKLMPLQQIINLMSPKSWDKLIYEWLKGFMDVYQSKPEGSLSKVRKLNEKLYKDASKIGNTEFIPFHRLTAMMSAMFEKAIIIQSKRINKTPLAYNLLLQQTIIIYLLLLAIFIPGWKGLLSVVFAWYLLYWLFHITNDFDDVRDDNNKDGTNLIHVDSIRIKNYLEELKDVNK